MCYDYMTWEWVAVPSLSEEKSQMLAGFVQREMGTSALKHTTQSLGKCSSNREIS